MYWDESRLVLESKFHSARVWNANQKRLFFVIYMLSFSISKVFMLFDKLQVTVKPWEERTGRLKLRMTSLWKEMLLSTLDLSQRGRKQLYTQTCSWDTHSHSTSLCRDRKSILTSLLRTLVSHKNTFWLVEIINWKRCVVFIFFFVKLHHYKAKHD